MSYLPEFLTVTTVTILAAMSPGPDFAVVTKNALSFSRRIGIFTSIGIALGLGVHVAYSLIGIGLIISRSIVLFSTIKYLGALYLIYIGYKALGAQKQQIIGGFVKTTEISPVAAIKEGFFTNALNPKATVFFLGLFTQVVSPATPLLVQAGYGIEIMLIAFCWFALLSSFLTHALVQERVRGLQHYLERAMGAVLIALGIKVALSSVEK